MNEISVRPSSVVRLLSIVTLFLVLASIAGQISRFYFGHDHLGGLVPLFYLDEEENIPNFWSSGLMLFAALLLVVIAALHRKQRQPVLHWAVLTFGFTFMAYDESFQVHEQLTAPMKKLLGGSHLGIFHYAWIIPGIALVCALGLFFLKFLWRLPATTRMRFLVAGAIYLGGAVGMEALDGLYADHMGEDNFTYSMLASVEETLEMVGLIAFIWSLLMYYVDNFGSVRVMFTKEKT